MHHVAPFEASLIFCDLRRRTQADQDISIRHQTHKMKILTLNFLTCAVKACKSSSNSFPLHPKDAELASDEVEMNPKLLVNLLPRIDWEALRTTSMEVRISINQVSGALKALTFPIHSASVLPHVNNSLGCLFPFITPLTFDHLTHPLFIPLSSSRHGLI